ncbi:hydroxymethylglutaryl-CoA synthase family protein [Streptomyces sp. LUP30]|uniref:hydroxymethylglutaryl-CoA synthase family protein n=1 Tax=Streptomyces sp. LUP30 TaxID=1890285 RepID=UPI000851AC85|nr:hydroxymethylglutaryl-CoA synthase [Streptomyces sp. LUP30]
MSATPAGYGIEALDVYAGSAAVSARAVFDGRNLDARRFDNVASDRRSVALPFEDPVTHAVNAARPLLDRLAPADRDRIELLVTSSESGIDYSKSIASYVHEHLGLPPTCRLVEMKQACYAATAALQLAVAYLAAGLSPGAKVLIVSTDMSLADERAQYAEPVTGTGAVALLVGDRPRVLTADLGAFGVHSFETLDSARPRPDLDIADADRSLMAYLECFSRSFADYRSRVEGADFATTFDLLALHTPFSGMVRAAHRRLMRELYRSPADAVAEDFERRVAPSLVHPGQTGNLFSGSLYLALASALDHAELDGPARVGLFSYGSGCSSEFFSGVVGPESAAAVAEARIGARLRARADLDFAEYTALLAENAACLRPASHRDVDPVRYDALLSRAVDRPELLALTGVRDHHRQYAWI